MSAVWGRDDLQCPLPRARVRQMLRDAHANPWRGDTSVTDRRHVADTTAITEPGRLTRVMLTFDFDYHGSGWFANSDYDRCLHLSVSHPRPDRAITRPLPQDLGTGQFTGMDLETPADDEARAWGLVFFRQYAQWAWFEPAVSPGDPYRTPNVVHLRLYFDKVTRQPILPRGEVYHLRPWEDGTSPRKITEGRGGADVS